MALLFYIMRHSLPDMTTGLKYDVLPGPALSAEGRQMAAAAAASFETPPTAIYTSPFARSRETAEIIGAKFDLPPIIDNHLSELAPGEQFDSVWSRTKAAIDEHAGAGELPLLVTHLAEIETIMAQNPKNFHPNPWVASLWSVDEKFIVTNLYSPTWPLA